MKAFIVLSVALAIVSCTAVDDSNTVERDHWDERLENEDDKYDRHEHHNSYGVDNQHYYLSHDEQHDSELKKEVKHIVTKAVPVPYPVEVEKQIPVHVNVPYPVETEKKVPIVVEKKYPVYVEKKVPVHVDRPVPYQVKVEVPVHEKEYIEVPKPYEVHVEKPYPVYMNYPVYIEKPVPFTVLVKKHEKKPFWWFS
nr:uncharacterized protein LOC109433435 [Aedes albopictus]